LRIAYISVERAAFSVEKQYIVLSIEYIVKEKIQVVWWIELSKNYMLHADITIRYTRHEKKLW